MEKVKITYQIRGNERTHYEDRFTNDEKENLKAILNQFDPECVKDFISHLQYLCSCVLLLSAGNSLKYKRSSKTDYKNSLKDISKHFKKTLTFLGRIKSGRVIFPVMVNLSDMIGDMRGERFCSSWVENQSLAIGAYRDLKQILENIQNQLDSESTKTGSPGTISMDFGQFICDAYMEHIGRPTSTISSNPGKGHFMEVLSFAFKAVGLPSEDVSKVARSVIPKRGI